MSVKSLHLTSFAKASSQSKAMCLSRQLMLLLILVFPLAWAQHEDEPHFLQNQTLCVDTSSSMIVLDHVNEARANTVTADMQTHFRNSLADALSSADVASSFSTYCADGDGYVVIFARVTMLDKNIYPHYGDKAFRYALSLQVGDKADVNYLLEHNILANLQFIAFEEQIASEVGQDALPFEEHLVLSSSSLIEQLVEAWQEDNP